MSKRSLSKLILGALLAGLFQFPVTQPAAAAEPVAVPLISRDVLFGNPDRSNVQLSPDGKYISYLSAVEGVMNVWVAPVDKLGEAKPVTSDKLRGIRSYSWAYTGNHLLYSQDTGGDENFHVYAVDLTAGSTTDLTPIKGVRAQIQEVSDRIPGEILVGLNDRDPQYHDIYRLNIKTGEKSLVFENDGYAAIMTDDDFKLRLAMKSTADGGSAWFRFTDGKNVEPFDKIEFADAATTSYAGFDKTGNVVYLTDTRGRNTGALFSVNLTDGKRSLVAESPLADIGGAMIHPTEKTIQAVQFEYLRQEWQILEPAIKPELDYLRTVADGDFNVTSRTLDDAHWMVTFFLDNGPVQYYRYDRTPGSGKPGKATFLFTNRKDLEGLKLAKMKPVVIKSRDGLNLVSYLTLPTGSDANNDGVPDAGPVPMILNVHGGPWSRDSWGFDPEAQLLANRGYACLQVNFRGSTGLGKEFLNAGNLEWAGKMHDDLVDAVNWAVSEKIADKSKVAIYGGSYGGYATLVGLTVTPDLFACGVDIVGPSNINTLLASIPPYWAPMVEFFKKRVGDGSSEEGRKFLEARSPLNFVDKINKPLLIGQGANDPRVKQAEADQIVKAMQEKNIPVTYVLFPDEGHGFARPPNRMAFYAITEAFLAQHLGGRAEPIQNELDKSTAEIRVGANQVAGLKAAPTRKPAAKPATQKAAE